MFSHSGLMNTASKFKDINNILSRSQFVVAHDQLEICYGTADHFMGFPHSRNIIG